jgi:hypothetical protein
MKINTKEDALKMIINLGFDYDGFDKKESLKSLIDELVETAKKGLKSGD